MGKWRTGEGAIALGARACRCEKIRGISHGDLALIDKLRESAIRETVDAVTHSLGQPVTAARNYLTAAVAALEADDADARRTAVELVRQGLTQLSKLSASMRKTHERLGGDTSADHTRGASGETVQG